MVYSQYPTSHNDIFIAEIHLQSNLYYLIAGNIDGHYIWRKSHKLDISNSGEILIWHLSVAVHIGKHALWPVINVGGFNIDDLEPDRQSAKFKSPPNFPAIRYMDCAHIKSVK